MRSREEPSTGRRRFDALHRAALALALLGSSCKDEAPATAEREIVDVEVAGCTRIREGVCRRPPVGPNARCEGASERDVDAPNDATPLRLWVRDHAGLLLGDAAPTEVRDGIARWDVLVAADTRQLALRRAGIVVWTLELEPASPEPDVLVSARHALAGADPRSALASLTRELDAMPDDLRAPALDVVTDLELIVAAYEQRDVPLEHTEQAFQLAVAHDEVDRASCHAGRAIFQSVARADFELALAWLQRMSDLDGLAPRTVASSAFYRGMLQRALGDLHHAREALEIAEAGAVAHGNTLVAAASREQLAEVSAVLGRELDVAEHLEAMSRAEGTMACAAWVRALNGAGWARFLARDLGRSAGDPIPDLDAALTIATWVDDDEDRCSDPDVLEHARLNLALAAASEGWIGWAEQLHAELGAPEDPAGELEFWLEQLELRLTLARADRGELVEMSMREAPDDPRPQHVWLREYMRGRALEALGLLDEALSAYARADGALQSMMLRVDVDEGRDRLLLGRQPSSAHRVALLVGLGREAEALCVARVARARTSHVLDRAARVAALDAEARRAWAAAVGEFQKALRRVDRLRADRWSVPGTDLVAHDAAIAKAEAERDAAGQRAHDLLGSAPASTTCEDLREPAPGELALLYFPVDEGWIGFAFDATGRITTATIPPGDPSTLLDPFADRIRDAEAIRVLPSAELWNAAFASLPFQGAPLVEHAPVVLSLDLQRRAAPTARPRRALVIGDPRGDLALAGQEAKRVAERLGELGVDAQLLVGAEADATAWRQSVESADLLHYAGHGSHTAFEGWGSAIRLAGDASVDVTGVLSLPRAPSVVVLPACRTAANADPGLGGAMNIARAFVLAGSDVVIAASTPLEDDIARELSLALYTDGAPTAITSPAVLRRAQLALDDPQRWSVYALVP